MIFESEVPGFLAGGFLLVTLVSLAVLIILLIRSRNKNLLFFMAQLAFLALAFYFFYDIATLPRDNSMYTEENSRSIALAGLCWAASMGCMLAGIYRMLKKSKVIYQF